MSRLVTLLALLFFLVPARADSGAEDSRYRLLTEALHQAEKPTGDWDPAQRDCAGFVRFLFRKAVFRGRTTWRDRHGQSAFFLKGDELIAFNFTRVTRALDPKAIETGDVLAFYSPDKDPADAWHLIVLLRPPAMAPDRILAAYHNGATGSHGEVRKVWLDDLVREAAPQWRPVPSNARFLGLFRWNGWVASASDQGGKG